MVDAKLLLLVAWCAASAVWPRTAQANLPALTASTSQEFFAAVTALPTDVPVQLIILQDIVLLPSHFPNSTILLSHNLTISSAAPANSTNATDASMRPTLDFNLLPPLFMLQEGVTLRLLGLRLFRAVTRISTHQEFMARSAGGLVLLDSIVQHRISCLPMHMSVENLVDGVPHPPGTPVNVSYVAGPPLCWRSMPPTPTSSGPAPGPRRVCITSYVALTDVSFITSVFDSAYSNNGGYIIRYRNSAMVCDHPASQECLARSRPDVCVNEALVEHMNMYNDSNYIMDGDESTPASSGSGSSSDTALVVGLAVGLGAGCCILASAALLLLVRWRRRRMLGTASPANLEGSDVAHRKAAAPAVEVCVAPHVGPNSSVADGGADGCGGHQQAASVCAASSDVPSASPAAAASSGHAHEEDTTQQVEELRRGLMLRERPLNLQLLEMIGQGSFGRVYKALWQGTLVALKVMVLPPQLTSDARRRQMALMEAAISSAMSHPNIVQTYTYSFRPLVEAQAGAGAGAAANSRTTSRKAGNVNGAAGEGADEQAQQQQPQGFAPLPVMPHGYELQLVLEYCDRGSLRAALEAGEFHCFASAAAAATTPAPAQQQQHAAAPDPMLPMPPAPMAGQQQQQRGLGGCANPGIDSWTEDQVLLPDDSKGGGLQPAGYSRSLPPHCPAPANIEQSDQRHASSAPADAPAAVAAAAATADSPQAAVLRGATASEPAVAATANSATTSASIRTPPWGELKAPIGTQQPAPGVASAARPPPSQAHTQPPAEGQAQTQTLQSLLHPVAAPNHAHTQALLRSPQSDTAPSSRYCVAYRYGHMLRVALDVASALLHLHSHEVVHGDVKASNVLLCSRAAVGAPSDDPRVAAVAAAGGAQGCVPLRPSSSVNATATATGSSQALATAATGAMLLAGNSCATSAFVAKVGDFGLATPLDASTAETHISNGTVQGTLTHMAPELLLHGHVSKRGDVYAYGVLLWELFTGERAFRGVARALLPHQVALGGLRPVFPHYTPPEFRGLAERCWMATPQARPGMAQIHEELCRMRDATAAAAAPEWLAPGSEPLDDSTTIGSEVYAAMVRTTTDDLPLFAGTTVTPTTTNTAAV